MADMLTVAERNLEFGLDIGPPCALQVSTISFQQREEGIMVVGEAISDNGGSVLCVSVSVCPSRSMVECGR